jgi:GDPmannose 4,6-dehydratase
MLSGKMKRIALITGITGQDGILLAEALISKGYEVVGFGRRASIILRPDLRQLYEKLKIVYGDLGVAVDIFDAIQRHQPDEIYNLAAQSAPAASWSQSDETGEITALGAHRLLEAVRRLKPDSRVYQASTSDMFGDARDSPQNEDTPFSPLNPYAAAKVYAHYIAKIYRRTYGMHISCGILFNHESPYRAMRFVSQKITYGAACAKLGILNSNALNEEGEPLVRSGKLALGNLDAARDWGHAKDYVEAMWRMLQRTVPSDYAIGTGQLRTVRELCKVAYNHVGKNWEDHVVTDPRFLRPSDSGPTVANASKARHDLNWSPTVSFEGMIAEMVDHHLDRLDRPESTAR